MTDGPAITRPGRSLDWLSPVLLTVSLHLMLITLVINHRLLNMAPPLVYGETVLQIAGFSGEEPDGEDADQGVADDEQAAPSAHGSVAEALASQAASAPQPRTDQKPAEPSTPTRPADQAAQPPADTRSLAERLRAASDQAGAGTEAAASSSGAAGGSSQGVATTGSAALRGKGRRGESLRRHGGSTRTEDAVTLGLKWLASVQDDDGRWDADDFMKHYVSSRSEGDRALEGPGYSRVDIGLTGLCLLAFTGAGNDAQQGDFTAAVRRAARFLLDEQRPEDGGFGLGDKYRPTLYDHSLATLAIADLYLLGGDESLREPLRRALLYLLSQQREGGGWDYDQVLPRDRERGAAARERNDLSITGWCVLALTAGREAGFLLPHENLERLAGFLKRCTRQDGEAVYADCAPRAGERGIPMMAVSCLSRRLLGEPGDSAMQLRQTARLSKNTPDWSEAGNIDGSMYGWYYGSLAMLLNRDQEDGAARWRAWNIDLQRSLLPNQEKTGGRRGSFPPAGFWADHGGGRVYSTALCVLCLEVYYRYDPEWLRGEAAELADLWGE